MADLPEPTCPMCQSHDLKQTSAAWAVTQQMSEMWQQPAMPAQPTGQWLANFECHSCGWTGPRDVPRPKRDG